MFYRKEREAVAKTREVNRTNSQEKRLFHLANLHSKH
jgi:hypothetical protein